MAGFQFMRIRLKYLTALVFCLLAFQTEAFPAQPQSDPRTTAERLHYFNIPGAVKESDPARKNQARDGLADIFGKNGYAFIYYALPAGPVADSFREFIQSVESARLDEQTGPAGGPASTVSKTGLVTLMSLALDSSDAIHTYDQNVATLRVNVDGLSRFLSNQEVIPQCVPGDLSCTAPGWLRKLELSAAYNITDVKSKSITGFTQPKIINVSTDTPDPDDPTIINTTIVPTPVPSAPAEFNAGIHGSRFAGATARYALFNRGDLRSVEFRERWIRSFQANDSLNQLAGREYWNYIRLVLQKMQQTGQNGGLIRDSGEMDQYTLWVADTREKLRNAPQTEEGWNRTLQEQLDNLLDKLRNIDRDFDARSMDLATAYIRYIRARRDPASTIVNNTALTVEYTYSEPALQPRQHTAKLAYAFSPFVRSQSANPGIVTLNIGADYYHVGQPTGSVGKTSHWKGGQVAMQFDRPLGPANSPAQLSIGAYYEYLVHPVMIVPVGAIAGATTVKASAGDHLLAPKGPLFSGNATVTLRMARNGVKVPIGISWSNRTDLGKGNEVRGHIGLTFDATPLLLLSGAK